MTNETTLSNLRHLYANRRNGAGRDTASAKRIATGLLGPVIEDIERREAQAASAPAVGAAAPILGWVRVHPNGEPSGEYLADACIEEVRKRSGQWIPLVAAPSQASEPAGLPPEYQKALS